MAKIKIVKANEKIAEALTDTFEGIESNVAGGYRKIEDSFVDRFLTREGESVEEAKARFRQAGARQA